MKLLSPLALAVLISAGLAPKLAAAQPTESAALPASACPLPALPKNGYWRSFPVYFKPGTADFAPSAEEVLSNISNYVTAFSDQQAPAVVAITSAKADADLAKRRGEIIAEWLAAKGVQTLPVCVTQDGNEPASDSFPDTSPDRVDVFEFWFPTD